MKVHKKTEIFLIFKFCEIAKAKEYIKQKESIGYVSTSSFFPKFDKKLDELEGDGCAILIRDSRFKNKKR